MFNFLKKEVKFIKTVEASISFKVKDIPTFFFGKKTISLVEPIPFEKFYKDGLAINLEEQIKNDILKSKKILTKNMYIKDFSFNKVECIDIRVYDKVCIWKKV